MEIKHDESYCYLYKDMESAGFTDRAVNKLCFQGYGTDLENSKKAIQDIKDYLEEHYKMYQYKKDNGVTFKECELFYWCNDGDNLYFTINLSDYYTNEHNNKIVSEILNYIENNYSHINGFVNIQYEERTDWNKVNNYILNTEFDINNLPFKTFRAIAYNTQYNGNTISIEARDKLAEINNSFLSNIENHKIECTFIMSGILGQSEQIIKGTVKRVNNGYGIFKPRATKTYYPFDMKIIENISVID